MNLLKKLLLSSVLLLFGTTVHAATIKLESGLGPSHLGDTITVNVLGEGFNDGITGGGFDLDFNPSVLQLGLVAINTTLFDFASTSGTTDNTNGKLTGVGFTRLFGDPSVNFLIATLEFLATGVGDSILDLELGQFNIVDGLGTTINITTIYLDSGRSVTAVPLPGAVWLMMGGLGLLGVSGRVRRA